MTWHLPKLTYCELTTHQGKKKKHAHRNSCKKGMHMFPLSTTGSRTSRRRGSAPVEEDLVVFVRERLLPRGHLEVGAVEREVGVVGHGQGDGRQGVGAHHGSRQNGPQSRGIAVKKQRVRLGNRIERRSTTVCCTTTKRRLALSLQPRTGVDGKKTPRINNKQTPLGVSFW